MELKLKRIDAYTVNSADDERRSSNKGVYREYGIAKIRCKGAGWYGSDGVVIVLKNVWQDESGILYQLEELGRFTDEAEKYRENLIESIKSKLTKEELELLNIK